MRHFHKHRLKQQLATGLFPLKCSLLVALLADHCVTRRHEGQEAVVIGLQIIAHDRVIVALGTLHIAPEKDAANIARHDIRFRRPVKNEAGGRPLGRILAICQEDFANEDIPRLILSHRLYQPGLPFLRRDICVRTAFHQHHIQHLCQMANVLRGRKKPVDQSFAFIGRGVGNECAGVIRSRRHANQIERHSAQKVGVRCPQGCQARHRCQMLIDQGPERLASGTSARQVRECNDQNQSNESGCRFHTTVTPWWAGALENAGDGSKQPPTEGCDDFCHLFVRPYMSAEVNRYLPFFPAANRMLP